MTPGFPRTDFSSSSSSPLHEAIFSLHSAACKHTGGDDAFSRDSLLANGAQLLSVQCSAGVCPRRLSLSVLFVCLPVTQRPRVRNVLCSCDLCGYEAGAGVPVCVFVRPVVRLSDSIPSLRPRRSFDQRRSSAVAQVLRRPSCGYIIKHAVRIYLLVAEFRNNVDQAVRRKSRPTLFQGLGSFLFFFLLFCFSLLTLNLSILPRE